METEIPINNLNTDRVGSLEVGADGKVNLVFPNGLSLEAHKILVSDGQVTVEAGVTGQIFPLENIAEHLAKPKPQPAITEEDKITIIS